MTIKWINELNTITAFLDSGMSVKDIAAHYKVQIPRIYQVFAKFGIPTPSRDLPSFFKNKDPKIYWLNQILIIKKIPRKQRIEILNNLELPSHCPIFGLELDYHGSGFRGVRFENSPSLDKIIPERGYVLDNIHIISWRANRIKNDASVEELGKIYKYFLNKS